MGRLLELDDSQILPDRRDEYFRIIRAIPIEQTWNALGELADMERQLLMAGIRALYPELSHRQVVAKMASLWFTDDMWEKAYGPGSPYMKKEN